jgi:hypothetical protein
MNTNNLTFSDMERITERSDRIIHIFFALLIIAVFLFIIYLTRRKDSD